MSHISVAEGISIILREKNVAFFPATSTQWLLSIGELTDSQDRQISMYDTGGLNPNPKWLLDQPTALVMIRGGPNDYSAAYSKAVEVKDALLGIDARLVGSGNTAVWWSGVLILSDIAYLRRDQNSRPIFSVNFRILQEPLPNALSSRAALDDVNG